MAATPSSIAGAAWLAQASVRAVFDALGGDSDTVRVVGGAVRDALLGRPVHEVDFATTLTPAEVSERAAAAGIKTVPTGIEHGTLTLVAGGQAFEVTTLRQDVETDGRHATVRFGTDWEEDARRRDFTINALSADRAGNVHDYVGGIDDLSARRVRFIGEARQRIVEDRLRILRFFRFHATIGRGPIDEEGLLAAIAERQGIRDLSAERIGQEMRRLLVAPGASDAAVLMQDGGILPIVLGGVGYTASFARFTRLQAEFSAAPGAELSLAALAVRVPEDAERLFARLRLSAAGRDRMLAALAGARAFAGVTGEPGARALLYRLGETAFRDAVLLAATFAAADADAWLARFTLPDRWSIPTFPLKGGAIARLGVARGPAIGALLAEMEAWWIAADFAPDEASIRQHLQQRLAAQQ